MSGEKRFLGKLASGKKERSSKRKLHIKKRSTVMSGDARNKRQFNQSGASKRIRQIEAKALRKMRHPTRIRKLEGFIELPDSMAWAAIKL